MLKARLLAVALALAAFAAPTAAGAVTRHPRSHSHHAAPSFPMKAEEYRALMDKRIDAVRAVIDRKLERRGVSADRRKAIHRVFDDAAKDVRVEIGRAVADGNVTQTEADRVKPLVTGLRARVRERLRAERDPASKEALAHEDAARKAKAAKEPPPKKAAAAEHGGSSVDDGGSTRRGAELRPQTPGDKPKDAAKPKATKAKSAKKVADHGAAAKGPTKQAKASHSKKPREAKTEPGANL